ncbi:hypothetical protein BV22DRAFT_1052558, partial [Leucogyrophana mollusca]
MSASISVILATRRPSWTRVFRDMRPGDFYSHSMACKLILDHGPALKSWLSITLWDQPYTTKRPNHGTNYESTFPDLSEQDSYGLDALFAFGPEQQFFGPGGEGCETAPSESEEITNQQGNLFFDQTSGLGLLESTTTHQQDDGQGQSHQLQQHFSSDHDMQLIHRKAAVAHQDRSILSVGGRQPRTTGVLGGPIRSHPYQRGVTAAAVGHNQQITGSIGGSAEPGLGVAIALPTRQGPLLNTSLPIGGSSPSLSLPTQPLRHSLRSILKGDRRPPRKTAHKVKLAVPGIPDDVEECDAVRVARQKSAAIEDHGGLWHRVLENSWEYVTGVVHFTDPNISEAKLDVLCREALKWAVQTVRELEANEGRSFDDDIFIISILRSARAFLFDHLPNAFRKHIMKTGGPGILYSYIDPAQQQTTEIEDIIHLETSWETELGYRYFHEHIFNSSDPSHPTILLFGNNCLQSAFDEVIRHKTDGSGAAKVIRYFDGTTWVIPATLDNSTLAYTLTLKWIVMYEWKSGNRKVSNTMTEYFREKLYMPIFKKILQFLDYIDTLPDNDERKIALNNFRKFQFSTVLSGNSCTSIVYYSLVF